MSPQKTARLAYARGQKPHIARTVWLSLGVAAALLASFATGWAVGVAVVSLAFNLGGQQ